nr:reverse transcriptase domain-containing protein [Tanacetum cinerariifolium]
MQNQCQNVQNQYQNLQNQMAALTDMVSKLVSANAASSSGSGTLPGNTITNPKEDLKGITTLGGVAYQGSKTPSPSKQETKVTKDQVQNPSSQNTTPVQPSVIQPQPQALVSEPVEKLSEMARTTMNEHCSVVILNKLPRKLGDPEKFFIPCEFPEMDECLALADLGTSINLMPLSVWEGLLLPELTPTCMTLELADRSVSKPIADFVVVDFEPDPRVPLILRMCFLKTSRALIDVHKEELTLRIGNEAITYNLDQTEADAFLGLEDDPDSLKINPFYYDPEGDILLLEAILNSEPSPPLPNQEQNLPSFKEELKAYKAQTVKSSVDEPPVELGRAFKPT